MDSFNELSEGLQSLADVEKPYGDLVIRMTPCPYCGAPPGYQCETFTRRSGLDRPHGVRVSLFEAVVNWVKRRRET